MSVNRKPLLQRAPIFMMPLLVMALSASLAKLLWMVVAPVQDVSAAPIMQAMAPLETQQPLNFGRMIADTHLFGEVPKAAPAITQMPQQAPPPPAAPVQPPIKLNLHGLWAKKRSEGRTGDSFKAIPVNKTKDIISKLTADLDSLFVLNLSKSAKKIPPKTPRGSAFAIMSQANGEQQMYSEGENIAEAVKVLEIFADMVVVENHGVKQEIFLSDGENSSTDIAQGSSGQQPPQSARMEAGDQGSPRPVNPSGRGYENLGQKDLRALRTDIMNDASLLAQYTAPEPLLLDGEVKGFRLHLSNRLRLLYQVGFRPGDVITELNGIRLKDPDTIQQILYNFISSDQLAVSVMRGQDEETFRYSFDG